MLTHVLQDFELAVQSMLCFSFMLPVHEQHCEAKIFQLKQDIKYYKLEDIRGRRGASWAAHVPSLLQNEEQTRGCSRFCSQG